MNRYYISWQWQKDSNRRGRNLMRKSKIAAALLTLGLAFVVTAQEIDWYSIDGGGGISTDGDIVVTGVIGQSDTIRMTGGNLSLSGGYLPLPPDSELIFKSGYE